MRLGGGCLGENNGVLAGRLPALPEKRMIIVIEEFEFQVNNLELLILLFAAWVSCLLCPFCFRKRVGEEGFQGGRRENPEKNEFSSCCGKAGCKQS